MKEQLEEFVRELTRKHNLRVESLTEEQFVNVLRQMILSGDIVKYVRPDIQQMVYIPFREVEKLKAEIRELEAKVKELEQFRPPC